MRFPFGLLLCAAACVAGAQVPDPGTMPELVADPMLAQRMASAAKPGDDALGCDEIAAEIAATGTDPQVQSVVQEQGAWAQGEMAKLQGAEANVESRASIAGQMFTGVLGAVIPNPVTGYAQQAAMAAQGARQGAEAQKNLAERMAAMQKIMTIMPQLMRGAHLAQLAQGKGCAFAAGAMPPSE